MMIDPFEMTATGGEDASSVRGGPVDWTALKKDVLAKLNVAEEFRALGVKLVGGGRSQKGWIDCHAIDRPDETPSAGINVDSGFYYDHGDSGAKLDFFDFATKHGPHGRWIDAMKHYADKAGVPMGRVAAKSKGRIHEETYLYRDADGMLRYGVFRYKTPKGGKDFTQHPADGKGGWRYGKGCMDDVEPLPYRLPEMLAQPDAPIWIVEGEKDAERLAALGLVATTNHQGSKSTDKTWPRFLHHFQGRTCYVVPDNDATGRDHAFKVASYLRAVAASVKLLTLRDLPLKGDVSDWLDLGNDAAGLRQVADFAAEFDPTDLPPGPTKAEATEDDFTTVCLADVEPEDVEWLLPDRIPMGKITLIAGEPGLGKSYLTMDLISRVTTSGLIPGGDDNECINGGSVVLLSAEDGLGDTIRPRLDKCGCDVRRVHALTTVKVAPDKFAPFDLTYMATLERAVAKFPDCKLVVIDPVTSYIGAGTDDHKNSSLRSVLGPLADLANRAHVAVLIITHLNKASGTKAMNRVTGSIAYAAMARAAWLIIRDPKDNARRLMLSIKNNLAPDPSGLAYRIVDGVVEWEKHAVTMTANDALAEEAEAGRPARGCGTENASKVEQAEAWLLDLLANGQSVPSEDILTQGEAKGFSRKTLFAAKKRADVSAKKHGYQGAWHWQLSQESPGSPSQNGGVSMHPMENEGDSLGESDIDFDTGAPAF